MQDQDAFTGTWKLLRCVTERDDGQLEHPMGDCPVGILVYDSQGRMSGQVMRPDRAKFLPGASGQDVASILKDAFDGYIAYFGTYSVDAGRRIVTHHVEGSLYPNLGGRKSASRIQPSRRPPDAGGQVSKTGRRAGDAAGMGADLTKNLRAYIL